MRERVTALAAVSGVWIGVAAAAAGAGWLTISWPVPVVGLFVAEMGVRATRRQSRPGICSAPPISCWRSPSAARRHHQGAMGRVASS